MRVEAETDDSNDKAYRDKIEDLIVSKAWFNAGVIIDIRNKERTRDEEVNETLSESEL